MSATANSSAIRDTLKTYFGYDAFRKHQREVIENTLNKSDSLVIMPTGGGKSICYQLPALHFEGLTIVISPLIALMKDQVDSLKANGIEAAFFNSLQTQDEKQEIFKKIDQKTLKLLYIAPESLGLIQPTLEINPPSCIAIDEAHCISSWGHDFRPSYQQLGFLKNKFQNTPILALTATADKATRQDIVNQLNISEADQFISSFNRENIALNVRPAQKRMEQIVRFVKDRPDVPGIVYCLSRKLTEKAAKRLQKIGVDAKAYHAGLETDERNEIHEQFISDKIQVVCATVAFGMGIDKPNVRFVVHHNLPKNIESYYQEIGRSGRDGLPATALLFHTYADVMQLRRFAEGASNEEFQLAKLDRMKEFAEATTCRRKMLLSYFGEYLAEDCGNCDVCENPPEFFEGTIIAQKFLSTIARLHQKEPLTTVVDVLRGTQNANVHEKGLYNVKTYGIGKDISWNDWQHYGTQLVNQGGCEIAFHQHNCLKLTEFSKKILFDNKKVYLTKPMEVNKQKAAKEPRVRRKKNTLFEHLRKLRLEIAQRENIPAFAVFNDATLRDMEREQPLNMTDFEKISGVGQRKRDVYGQDFINAIKKFLNKHPRKGDTYKVTLQMIKEGKSIEEIAEKRDYAKTTILGHILKLHDRGEAIDLMEFIDDQVLEKVKIAKSELDAPDVLKPYFEYFDEEVSYGDIRCALRILEAR